MRANRGSSECEAEETVYLGGKCKASRGNVIHFGSYEQALHLVIRGQIAYIQSQARGAASSTGFSGAASSTGDRGAASSTGEYSTVSCGKHGIAATTATHAYWKVTEDSAFVQRTPNGLWTFLAKPEDIGKTLYFVDGVLQESK